MEGPPTVYLKFPLESDRSLRPSQRRVGMSWGTGDDALVFISAINQKQAQMVEMKPQLDQLILLPEWNKSHPTRRNFINATYVNFNLMQKLASDVTEPETLKRDHKKKLSRKYIEHIKNQIDYLHSLPDLPKEIKEQELNVFQDMLVLWSMCEIIFITGNPGDLVVEDFLEWVNLIDPEKMSREELDKIMEGDLLQETPQSKEYWAHIFKSLLRGEKEAVRNLLAHYPHGGDFVQRLNQVLAKMPRYPSFHSDNEFISAWNEWQQQCSELKNSFAKDDSFKTPFERTNFQLLSKILLGDLQAIQSQRETWYEELAAVLLFVDPSLQSFDLIQYVQKESKISLIDQAVFAAFEYDVSQVLIFSSQIDPWLSCHLTDFLHHIGQLEMPTENLPCDLREFFMLEYSRVLMNQSSLWRIAADYLLTCPVFGRAHIEQHLGAMHLESDLKARKVLTFCNENSFEDLFYSISDSEGERKERQGMYGAAIEYYLQAKKISKVERVIDRVLESYWTAGKLTSSDIIQNVSKYADLSEKLAFLKRYIEFHDCYRAGKFHTAGKHLVQILTSNPAPKNFWPTVLVDAIPLLEAQEVIFDTNDTYELMRCLEEILSSRRKTDLLRGVKESDLEVVRLALVRNLARSMMLPGAF